MPLLLPGRECSVGVQSPWLPSLLPAGLLLLGFHPPVLPWLLKLLPNRLLLLPSRAKLLGAATGTGSHTTAHMLASRHRDAEQLHSAKQQVHMGASKLQTWTASSWQVLLRKCAITAAGVYREVTVGRER